MMFNVKVKPAIYKGETKDILISNMNLGCLTCSKYGWYHQKSVLSSDDYVYVYNVQKYRPKFKQTVIKSGKNKGNKKSVKVRAGYWEGFLYKVPKALLDLTHQRVEQGSRTFTFLGR